MNRNFDVIVIGLGGMGSATLYELARRGVSVLGIEQFDVAHALGSSHGDSRLIRRGYFEHPDYVPLVDAAYNGWHELEAACGKKLFFKTGLYLAGPPDGELIAGTRLAASRHNLPIETLAPADSGRRAALDPHTPPPRFPAFIPDKGMDVLYEADAGFLLVEECVRTFVDQARLSGADAVTNTAVMNWRREGPGFQVETANGLYRADRLVICGGPWAGGLLKELRFPLTVLRKVVLWYEIEDHTLTLERGLPVFGFDALGMERGKDSFCPMKQAEDMGGLFYGFPSTDGRSLKIAEHTGGRPADPDALDRTLHPEDEDRVVRFIDRHVVGLSSRLARHSVCMYTMSPDQHFIIDRHPADDAVAFAAGFSGHGFKFAPVIGSALADLATGREPPTAMSFLRLDRFSRPDDPSDRTERSS